MGRQAEQHKRTLSKGEEKYSKVSHKDKLILLKRVFCDRQEIKKTSEELGVNYSTAKTLMRRFKTRGQKINHSFFKGVENWFKNYATNKRRCGYSTLEPCEESMREERNCAHNKEQDSRDSSFKFQEDHEQEKTPVKATQVTICQQVLFKE